MRQALPIGPRTTVYGRVLSAAPVAGEQPRRGGRVSPPASSGAGRPPVEPRSVRRRRLVTPATAPFGAARPLSPAIQMAAAFAARAGDRADAATANRTCIRAIIASKAPELSRRTGPMLTRHTSASAAPNAQDAKPFWVDLLHPTPAEAAQVAAEFGVQVPTRESLMEIETSSRLRADGETLYVSMPLPLRDAAAGFAPVPLGFVLSPELLVTVRFAETSVFTHVKARVGLEPQMGSAAVFAALIDGMVDFSADMLEKFSSELATVSARVFGRDGVAPPRGRPFTSALRESLNAVGAVGDHLSRTRESLLGLQRIIAFAAEMAANWLRPELKNRLKTARADLSSLVAFESQLSGQAQFLLDAILGFISTEQNDIFKVLTIVSVVGIPPTLIASMYGMNFHYMPELAWRWGYPFGLALIAFSTILPILWFKRRGWW